MSIGTAAAAAVFCIGLLGVLTRRDVIAVLAAIEVMLGGAMLLLVSLTHALGRASHVAAIGTLLLVVLASEAAVALALLVAVARARSASRVEDLREVRG